MSQNAGSFLLVSIVVMKIPFFASVLRHRAFASSTSRVGITPKHRARNKPVRSNWMLQSSGRECNATAKTQNQQNRSQAKKHNQNIQSIHKQRRLDSHTKQTILKRKKTAGKQKLHLQQQAEQARRPPYHLAERAKGKEDIIWLTSMETF